MSLDFPDFFERQSGNRPVPKGLLTGSSAVFTSHSVGRQPDTLTSENSVKGSGAAPAKSENTSSLCRRKLSDLREEAKAVMIPIMNSAADDGNRTCKLAETDPLQGINRADPDIAFRHLCIEDDGAKLSHLLAEMDEKTRQNWLNSPLDFSKKNDTPIIYAARHGHTSVASALMSHGADPLARNPYSEMKYHALLIAAQENQATVIEEMAKWHGFLPNKPADNGVTAIFHAAGKGAFEAVETLLKFKADPNYFIRCCIHSDNNIMLPGGEPVQPDGSILPTALLSPVNCAVLNGDAKMLALLLEYGASANNPDPGNPHQCSPLGQALIDHIPKRSPALVALLLKSGADMYERIPVKLSLNEEQMHYRPSLLELMSQRSFLAEDTPYFRVLYNHFCETYGSQVSYGNFRNYFLFMSLVKSYLSFPETMEVLHCPFFYHSLIKNFDQIESVLSDPSPGASQLSEENRLFFYSFCECNKVLVNKGTTMTVSPSEFEHILRAWIAKVETMGINHFLLIPEIKELLEQEPYTSIFEWVHSQLERIKGFLQTLYRRTYGY